jgi:hypothetical protein
VAAPATAPVAEAKQPWEGDDEPATASNPIEVPKANSSDKANDILAMIRARQNKTA